LLANAAVDAAQTEGLHDIQVVKSQQEVADTKAKVLDKINATAAFASATSSSVAFETVAF
jgi:hypothetical protein